MHGMQHRHLTTTTGKRIAATPLAAGVFLLLDFVEKSESVPGRALRLFFAQSTAQEQFVLIPGASVLIGRSFLPAVSSLIRPSPRGGDFAAYLRYPTSGGRNALMMLQKDERHRSRWQSIEVAKPLPSLTTPHPLPFDVDEEKGCLWPAEATQVKFCHARAISCGIAGPTEGQDSDRSDV